MAVLASSPAAPRAATDAELHSLLDQVLDTAVHIATGMPDATARTGQRALAHDVLDTMVSGGQLAREAPTGSGKSFAALAPAMLLTATRSKRTLISTETLGLQSQYLAKDVPVVTQAVVEVLGLSPAARPASAVLKGWSNTVCTEATLEAVGEAVGPVPDLEAAVGAVESAPASTRRDLVRWALAQVAGELPGDRADYPGVLGPGDWESVSVSPSECPGVDRCRFGSTCRPAAARAAAADADVIVTNHSMLAVQAAKAVPVVLGNERLGVFDHLVVDEAHGLASKVRDQGATQIDAFRLVEIAKAAAKVVDESDRRAQEILVDERSAIATALDASLAGQLDSSAGRDGSAGGDSSAGRNGSAGRPRVVKVPADADPLGDIGPTVVAWAAKARRVVPDPRRMRPERLAELWRTQAKAIVSLWRVHAKIDALLDDLRVAGKSTPGVARWIEEGSGRSGGWTGTRLKVASVNAAGPLRANLYQAGGGADDDDDGTSEPGGVGPESPGPSVVLMSATLPAATVADTGLPIAARRSYPSPFEVAYRQSWAYVPSPAAGAGGAEALRRGRGGFDTAAHPALALRPICELVEANGGSALVLAATAAAGRFYAEALRSRSAETGAAWRVLSQWDGAALAAQIAAWREDHHAVLVGTRSLMTGVDAPGGTCSLVIVDRVPRAAGNPLDDARVAEISARLDIDRWAADRLVYVADATLLLYQAAGRLIRSETDAGVVAILDPRLLRAGTMSYPEPTRKAFVEGLGRFGRRSAELEAVCAWMRGRGR